MTLDELVPRQREAVVAVREWLEHSPAQLKVFNFLFERSKGPHAPPGGERGRTARAVADGCGFPDEETARAYINRTRKAVHRFKRSIGARRLSYIVRIREQDHGVTLSGSGLYLRKFWRPYVDEALRRTSAAEGSTRTGRLASHHTTLSYIANLFLRAPHERQEFLRRFYINNSEDFGRALQDGNIPGDVVPRRHYVSAGVMRCCLDVAGMLTNFTVHVRYSAQMAPWRTRCAPLVIIGNGRTHPTFIEVQNSQPLDIRLDHWGVSILDPLLNEQPLYRDDLNEGGFVYGLVSRTIGPKGQPILMIGANHGHTFFALGKLLTQNLAIKGLFDRVGVLDPDEWPLVFQLVVRMPVLRDERSGEDEMPGPAEYVTSRGFRNSPGLVDQRR